MKVLTTLSICILMAGCASLVRGPDFYTLDLERTQICYGDSGNCLNLELIIPSYYEGEIARAYKQPFTADSWNVPQLVELMLAPPGQLYEAIQIDEYRYRLPHNDATFSVWYYLEQEQLQLYEVKGGGEVAL